MEEEIIELRNLIYDIIETLKLERCLSTLTK